MSNIKNEITENINSQPKIRIQSFKNNNISQISEKSKEIKVKNNKYKFNYSNNNNNNISKINIKCVKSKNISISPNKKSSISPSKLNCETNYSINKINNTYYVNGLNKNISKFNSTRSPDLRFIPFENKEIYEKKKFIHNIENNNNYYRNNLLNKNRNEKNENYTNLKYTQYFSEKESNLNMNTYLIENNNTIVKSSKRNNHSFRSVSNCSRNNRSQSNPRKSSNERKYKYDIRIHNINNNTSKERIRPFSYDNNVKKRRTTNTQVFISDNSKKNNDLKYEFNRNKSFDRKYLKMQNSQNLQILQEERLYQILIPIPPNEKDHTCHFEIPSTNIKKESKKINIKEENEIISKKIFKKNIKQGKKISWIKSTSPKKENNKNEEYEIISKISEESNRKFKGEMKIEKNALNFERTPRNWNDNIQPKTERYFSIEHEEKKEKERILSETSVEKISIDALPHPPPVILSQQNKAFSIKGIPKKFNDIDIYKEEEENIINDEEIGKEVKGRITIQRINNGLDNSESSSEYDALKQITTLNSKKYENIVKNGFKNQRKVIINNICRRYPYSHIQKDKIKNEIQMKKNINETLEIKNKNNNFISNFPEPDLIINPHYEENKLNEGTQYNYRQSITNKEIPYINDEQNQQNEISKEQISEEENDILDSPTDTKVNKERKNSNIEESQSQGQTDVPSPKSQLREEFREEIISLSPRNNEKEPINNKREINYMEEEYKIYANNIRQSEQLIENDGEEEQEELIEKERESNKSFSFKMNNNNHLTKPKYKYICKTKSNKSNKGNNNENRTVMTQVIDNNSIIQNNGIISQNINNNSNLVFQNKRSIEDLNMIISNNNNNNNMNKINLEENNKQLNDNDINNFQNNNNIDENIRNLNMIYNSQKIKKNNDISNLNEITFQRSNGLSKSQLLKKENNNFIQNNKFGNISKINLGNVYLNNTLKRPLKTEIRKENINEEANLIHHYEAKKDGNHNQGYEFKQNQNNRVKIIKK